MEEPDQYVDFMVKYNDWISFKRLGIRPDTKPHQVVYQLAAIRGTIDNKAYKILGIKTDILDTFADNAVKGRKSAGALTEALTKFTDSSAKAAIEQSCDNKDLKPLAEIYLLGRLIKNAGYDTSINQVVMSRIFPDLKPPPKPKGRMPGSGKKKEAPEE